MTKRNIKTIFTFSIKTTKTRFIKKNKIEYAFCVSKFLQDKFQSNQLKYNNMLEILEEDNIKLFFGEDKDYFDLLFSWLE